MNKKKKSNGSSILGTLAALIILCVVLTICSNKFLTYSNIMSVLKQTTFTALLASGMLLCLITAGIDLSVGANATFCACVMGMMVKAGITNPVLLLVVALVVGTLDCICAVADAGTANRYDACQCRHEAGYHVAECQNIRGVDARQTGCFHVAACAVNGTAQCSAGQHNMHDDIDHDQDNKADRETADGCGTESCNSLRETGNHLRTGNQQRSTPQEVLHAEGRYERMRQMQAGQQQAVNQTDKRYDTDAIAACVIGGASFMGGKGTMAGTLIGALVIAVLRNGFTLLAIDSSIQNMVLGLVIIGAVLLDVTRESMAAKARRKEAAAKA